MYLYHECMLLYINVFEDDYYNTLYDIICKYIKILLHRNACLLVGVMNCSTQFSFKIIK